MDYEKKYKEALEWARKVMQGKVGFVLDEVLEKFPELKESEGERIREVIYNCVEWFGCDSKFFSSVSQKECLAWLEKQGGHAKFRDSIQVGDKVTRNEDGVLVNLSQLKRVAKKGNMGISEATKQKLEDNLNKALEKETPESWNEFLDEQKPADKVEAKFKEGNWVIWDNKIPCHVDNIYQGKEYLMYTITDTNNMTRSYSVKGFDNNAHLWTIADAKDGDVLFTSSTASHETFIFKNIDEKGNAKCYFAYDSEDGFREGKYHFIGRATDCKPATKEQRDLLFQKMKEAGYEWNADKKELKKIEQKSAWSEEDEAMWAEISNLLWEGYKQSGSKFSWDDIRNWVNPKLKSFKDKVQPQLKQKWSEEDKKMIQDIINDIAIAQEQVYCKSRCEDEITWLKSLKDRVQSQPKQEWSEEDEKMYNVVHNLAWESYKTSRRLDIPTFGIINDWLKSLRAQNTWKPSDEQMEALDNALSLAKNCGEESAFDLRTLYEHLKKLREK